jgi:hypothetical protein
MAINTVPRGRARPLLAFNHELIRKVRTAVDALQERPTLHDTDIYGVDSEHVTGADAHAVAAFVAAVTAH